MKKDIIKSIRIITSSMDSHLESAIDKKLKGKIIGNRQFHLKTIKEYHYVIGVLIKLL